VAGVAEPATTGSRVCAGTGTIEDADDAAATTGVVSTTGEKFGAADVGISSGLAVVPAANDSLGAAGDWTIAALGDSAAGLFLAKDSPGIGLGSIAGIDSVCASAKAVAASAAGAGDVAKAGLCIQPLS